MFLLDILQDLLVIEQKIALAVQHVVDGGGEDLVIVAVEPEVGVLPDVGGVVARVQRPDVVDHREQDVLVVGLGQVLAVPLPSNAVKRSIGSTTGCTITEKAPTRAFSWLKAPTSAFTFKTLLRQYAKRALTPQSHNVKLGP